MHPAVVVVVVVVVVVFLLLGGGGGGGVAYSKVKIKNCLFVPLSLFACLFV